MGAKGRFVVVMVEEKVIISKTTHYFTLISDKR
jgi:hypothetical protein